jgi:hypothetical protein
MADPDLMAEFEDVVRSIMERLGPDAPLSKILWECRREVLADAELQEALITHALTNMIAGREGQSRKEKGRLIGNSQPLSPSPRRDDALACDRKSLAGWRRTGGPGSS